MDSTLASLAVSVVRLLLFYSVLLLVLYPAMHAVDRCLNARRAATKR
jgi:hypothetical protein